VIRRDPTTGLLGAATYPPQYDQNSGHFPSFACNLGCESFMGTWYVPSLGAAQQRAFHPRTETFDNGAELVKTAGDHLALGSNGTDYLVMYGHRVGSNRNPTTYFRAWSSSTGWLSPTVVGGDASLYRPHVVWTGSGYVVVATYLIRLASDGPTLTPDDRSRWRAHLWHLAPDGTIRQEMNLGPGAGFLPNAVWAGGRIALTWIEPKNVNGGPEPRYLAYLDCAP
jgi:hypothetical protein